MKKFRWMVAALAILSASACGSGAGAGGGDVIKLGAWMPLSGPQAATGVPQRVGYETFFDQLNANGGINGKKVEWKVIDDQYDPQQTLQAARLLTQKERVAAILGSAGTGTTEAAFPLVLDQSKIPIIGTMGGTEAWYEPAREGLFGTQVLSDSARVATRWAIEEGAKRVAVVRNDPSVFVDMDKAARDVLKTAGVSVDTVEVRIGTTDYAPVLNKVKALKPDAVMLFVPAQEAAAYLNEAALQGVHAPAYGYFGTLTNSLLELAGDNAEGFRAAALTLPPTDKSKAVQEYRDALKKYAPGQEPDFMSLACYATAKLFTQYLQGIQGDATPASITAQLESGETVATGILPPVTFSSSSHLGIHDGVRIEVVGGQFVAQGSFEPAA